MLNEAQKEELKLIHSQLQEGLISSSEAMILISDMVLSRDEPWSPSGEGMRPEEQAWRKLDESMQEPVMQLLVDLTS